MRRLILPRSWWLATALALALGGCDDKAEDGGGLAFEWLADQPHSPELGVLLEVHARGGSGVKLSIEEGTLQIDAPGDAGAPAQQTTACVPGATNMKSFSFVLSVRPVAAEALLYATLKTNRDCSGDTVQDRLLVIRPLVPNPAPQDAGAPTVDALMDDASTEDVQ